MAKRDAEVTVGADATAVQRAMAVGKAAVQDFATSATSAIGGAASQVGTTLAGVALAHGKINFSSQSSQVREFEATTARFAVAANRDLESVRSSAESVGHEIGKRPGEVIEWSAEVGRLSYSFDEVEQSLRGVAGLAAETGRSVDEYRGLALTLRQAGVAGKDTSTVLGVIQAQADAVGTKGGVAALTDQFEAAADSISRMSDRGKEGVVAMTALMAVLGKDLKPGVASMVAQGAVGSLESNPFAWERYLGHHVLDEHGQVDPTKAKGYLQEITEKARRTYRNPEVLRRAMGHRFGAPTAMALLNADWDKAAELQGLAPSGKPQAAQGALLGTDAGKRQVAEADLAISSRQLMGSSTALGKAADSLQKFAAHNPLSSTFIATALGTGLSTFLAKFGGSLATMMGGPGKGGAVGGVIDLATKGIGGVGGLAVKAGLLGAAALGGYAAGTAIDESLGVSDWISGTGRSSRAGVDARENDRTADPALRNRLMAIREVRAALEAGGPMTKDTAIGSAAVQSVVGRGDTPTMASVMAELRKGGQGDADVERIAKGIVDALQRGVKFNVINSTGGPVEVTGNSSSSGSAGNQSRG
jgi:hypothetical protein